MFKPTSLISNTGSYHTLAITAGKALLSFSNKCCLKVIKMLTYQIFISDSPTCSQVVDHASCSAILPYSETVANSEIESPSDVIDYIVNQLSETPDLPDECVEIIMLLYCGAMYTPCPADAKPPPCGDACECMYLSII